MSDVFSFLISDPSDLNGVAEKILSTFAESRVFAITGEMGAGKTTFIKAICTNLKVIDTVASPTYPIIYEYKAVTSSHQEEKIFHIDAYRLNSESEALRIGMDEILSSGNYCFIEWPEKIISLLPDNTIRVNIEVMTNGQRKITAHK